MNRRTFVRSLGLTGLASQGATLGFRLDPALAVGEKLASGRLSELLTPQPRQATFNGAVTTLDAMWGLTVIEPGDPRAAALADRISGHLTQLGGPRLPRDTAQGGQDRRRIVLVVLGSAPAAGALLTGGLQGPTAQLLATRESRLPARTGGPGLTRREAYSVVVGPERIVLAAHAVEGLLLGGQTLMQLMSIGALEQPGRIHQATILDWPEVALRGYLADVRKPPYRFAGTSLDGWKRHIDRLAAAKCNYIVLEHSLTFQYAFAGEAVGLPGGLRIETGRVLSEHAHAQGLMAIPVVELSRGDSLRPYMQKRSGRHSWMADHRNAGFCPFNDLSYEFIDRMLVELAAAFPHSPYLHVGEDETGQIGGSEVCPRCQPAVARFAANSRLPPDPIGYPMAYFQTRVSELAKRHGLQTMVWGTYAFLNDNGIRDVVPRVMTKDVIVWDWLEKGFGRLGYQTWLPYVPSWEWKGPGVRELVTHMVAFANKANWDARQNQSAAGMEAFARAWSLTTFGLDEPEVGRRCLAIFGRDPYGWAFQSDSDVSRNRWLRLRFGGYLCLRPEEFKEPNRRHSSVGSLEDDIRRMEEHGAFFERVQAQASLNRSLLRWYANGARLSLYGLLYVRALHRAHQALQEASRDAPEGRRRPLIETARAELQAVLDRFDGPITAAVQLSLSEIGGPILDSPTYSEDLAYDLTGVKSGVRKAVESLLQRVGGLSPGRPGPQPASVGLFPAVAGG